MIKWLNDSLKNEKKKEMHYRIVTIEKREKKRKEKRRIGK